MNPGRIDVSKTAKLEALATQFRLEWLKSKVSMVLWLEGPMGSGKTTFVRSVAGGQASSPSFALSQTYSSSNGPIIHWDLDRLKSKEEFEGTGFFETFKGEKKLVVVEWCNRLSEFGYELMAPRDWLEFHLKWIIDGKNRSIDIRQPDSKSEPD